MARTRRHVGPRVGTTGGLSGADASGRSSRAHPVRGLLQDRRFSYRPDPRGRAGADHAWPLGSCARRSRRGARNAGNARHHAAAIRREFRRQHAGDPLWRERDAQRRPRHLPSRRARARLGADRRRGQRPANRRVGRLQGRSRPHLHAVRVGALRRVHHRGDVRPAGVPPRQSRRRNRAPAALGAALSGARSSRRRLLARQGAARDRLAAQGRLRHADLSARRHGQDHPLLRRADRSRRTASRQRCQESGTGRRHRDRAAVRADRPLVAPVSRPGNGVRVGLDAGAGAGAPARHRTAAGDLGSRRLGRADLDHRGDRRFARSG